jgi:hypothetical protein
MTVRHIFEISEDDFELNYNLAKRNCWNAEDVCKGSISFIYLTVISFHVVSSKKHISTNFMAELVYQWATFVHVIGLSG